MSSNDLDNTELMMARASYAARLGERDADDGRPVKSSKQIEALILAGDSYRKGHALFIRKAYLMGRFNIDNRKD